MPDSTVALDDIKTELRREFVAADNDAEDLSLDDGERGDLDDVREYHHAKGKVAGLRAALNIVDDAINGAGDDA